MDPDQPSNSDAPPPQTAPAPQSAPTAAAYSQADIDAARKQAHDAAWGEARRTYEAKQKPAVTPAKRDDAPAPASTSMDAHAILKLRDDFDDAIGDLSLNRDQKKLIRELVMERRPDDVGSYVQTFAQRAGWKNGNANTPPPATAPAAAPQPSGPPVTSNGAPSSPTAITDDTPILRLSPADQLALQKRIGVKAFTDRMTKEFREHGTRVRLR